MEDTGCEVNFSLNLGQWEQCVRSQGNSYPESTRFKTAFLPGLMEGLPTCLVRFAGHKPPRNDEKGRHDSEKM